MQDLRLSFALWFEGDAPPDVAAMTMPIAIPVQLHRIGSTGGAQNRPARQTILPQTGDADV
ncbi:MAG: hypothetical protein WDN25_09295 [Acetobacteraceae bacterium]